MVKIILLTFLCLVIKFSVAEWTEPYFTDIPDYVEMSQISTNPIFITFSMNEEIPVPFTLAFLNGYSGTEQIKFSEFTIGNNLSLGLELLQQGSRWVINITKRQDYENPANQQYRFTMISETFNILIDIKILNIFDNIPTIVALENPCFVDELNEEDYISDCHFNVTDIDGMTGNNINFKIEGNNNEPELFGFKAVKETPFSNIYAFILKKTLHYEDRSIYSFQIIISDIGGNTFSLNIIIRINDIPNLPPMWTKVFASAQFDEKQPTDLIYEAKAIDGDTGINTEICYILDFENNQDYSNLISINDESGEIRIKSIDRDSLKINFFPFNVTARKCNNITSYISSSAVLIVNDINDNAPEIYFNASIITLYEETIEKLFSSRELIINDIDLNQNAQYNVFLYPVNYAAAFSLVPESGYQEQSFTISVLQPEMLDYDKTDIFRNFELMIIAEEINQEHSSNKTFRVELINWNDELPYFLQNEYVFEVEETVGEDYIIGNLEAKDDDFNDTIQYYLTDSRIKVGFETGQLSTKINNAFDYEQQHEVSLQVFANDTLLTNKIGEKIHTTSTQVRIIVKDINDTPPSILQPRKFLSVIENDRFAIITDEIYVRDPDTTASLSLIIDWDQSFASGQNVSKSDYVECIEIETEQISQNELKATLKVNSSHLIDYEKFQLLFLTLTAIDSETVINNSSTSVVLTITIIDENDNAPEFVGNTLSVSRSVIENSEAGIFVGFINAIDIDGPGNNEISYSLIAKDQSTDGWLKINSMTGEISVDADKIIDCDTPPRESLEYIVHLTDGLNENEGNISIRIIDTNNKFPQILPFENSINIYENASDVYLRTVLAHDEDRDAPHNVLAYSIDIKSNPELERYFEINKDSGELRVRELDDLNKLDRDTEPSTYSVLINVVDNMGNGIFNLNSTTVQVILLDVNDNAPQMPPTLNFVSTPINETFKQSDVLVEHFYAPDIDEEVNAEVTYKISSIESIEIDNIELPNYENLFDIISDGKQNATIVAGIDFKGFSGKWAITIVATDNGHLGDSKQNLSSSATYEIIINPHNYNRPQIIFPENGSRLRLDLMSSDIGRQLILLNSSRLKSFEALDDDAGIYGDVTFNIDSDNGDHVYFELVKFNRMQTDLHIIREIEEKVYTVSIIAIDGGGLTSERVHLTLAFIDRDSQPYFENHEWKTDFTENVTGLEEIRFIPHANDVKNEGLTSDDDIFQIYYFIDDTYSEDAKLFTLNSISGELRLNRQLDREEIDHHSIRIIATNHETKPDIRFVVDNALLIVNIEVNDVNDNPPTFIRKIYVAGISDNDERGKEIEILEATDIDLNDIVTYYILKDTMKVSNEEELSSVKDTAFELIEATGVLKLNFTVRSTMTGFFEFKVEARDLADNFDVADVKISVVSESNRVPFIFDNTTSEVENANRDILLGIFSNAYDADCRFDDITSENEESNRAILRVHFAKDDEIIDGKTVNDKSNDIVLYDILKSQLMLKLNLVLEGIQDQEKIKEDSSQMLDLILSIIVGILSLVLCVLIVIHILRSKSYVRQIKALSQKNFEPITEKFHNVNAVPNTNLYSEGRQVNPVLMSNTESTNKFDADTKSIISTDSDDFANLDDKIFNISSSVDRNYPSSSA